MGIPATYSYAGAVNKPTAQPLPVRVGGFGGSDGLANFIHNQGVTHLIDATHPFAAQISANAAMASRQTDTPMVALVRPPWRPETGDTWNCVKDVSSAAEALPATPKRVFLAIGRTDISAFTKASTHHYLLRFVDTPNAPPVLPNHELLIARGPFDVSVETALLKDHRIDVVVSKNSGGTGAIAKLEAARALGLPVVMIERPAMPTRNEVSTVEQVITWLSHDGTERGV